jgi:REP element-mobilizing transposase RayT
MPQSLYKIYTHITFSTKNRYPFLDEKISSAVFQYIGGLCKALNCQPIVVGGYRDHIHILCLLPKDETFMKLIQLIKSHSSKWVKSKGLIYQKFYWQKGYGIFSVTPSHVEKVKSYILHQEKHHKKLSFQQEYRLFLEKYNIEYNEKYVWD